MFMTKRTTTESAGLVPASTSPDLDGPEMREWAAGFVDRARAQGVDLTGEGGLLTAMVRQVLQTGLEVELEDHLGYRRMTRLGATVATRGTGRHRRQSRPRSVMSS